MHLKDFVVKKPSSSSLGCPTQRHFPFDWLITKIQGSNGLKSGASGSMPLSVQMWYSFVIEHWKKTKATTNICMYSPSFYQISFTSFWDKMSTNSDFLDIFFLSNKSNMVLLAWTTKLRNIVIVCHHHCLRQKKNRKPWIFLRNSRIARIILFPCCSL